MKLSEFNDYELGFAKGVIAARQGTPELEVLDNEPNERAREGIREGYSFVTGITVTDATKLFRGALEQFVSDSTQEARFNLLEAAQCVIDSVEEAKPNNDIKQIKFNAYLRALAKRKGLSLTDQGLFNRESGKLIASSDEDIFKELGLEYIKPEDREI